MRHTHICPKCQHNRILLVAQVPDTGEFANEIRHLNIARVRLGEGFFGEKLGRAGELSAVVCRRCGYSELYAAEPEKIPIDNRHVTELVGKPPYE